MKSPRTVQLKDLKEAELAYRKMRDDLEAINTLLETINTALAALTIRVEALEP